MAIRAASPLARYGLAVLATVLAFLLRLLLWPLLGEASPFLLFTLLFAKCGHPVATPVESGC